MKVKFKFLFAALLVGFSIFTNFANAQETPSSDTETIPEAPVINPTSTFIIRINDNVLFQGSFTLLDEGSVSIADNSGSTYSVNSRSVLATLKALDEANDSFSVSNLTYYPSFSSFYLKCILPQGGVETCDNWQYALGSSSPWQSIDQLVLSGGETVGIYFGNPHKIETSPTTAYTGEEITLRSLKYDYQDNSWIPLTGVSIGVLLPNPENPWSPNVLSTHSVDSSGIAKVTLSEIKDYLVGITEDYYFPTFSISVIDRPYTGGGSSPTEKESIATSTETKKVFDLDKAFNFLKGTQESNGSFANSPLYSDWASFAYGAYGAKDEDKVKLIKYLTENSAISKLLTDNERRAISLLALGLNPYDFNGFNYIEPILKSFDGKQFGEEMFLNDDIFALLVLANSGFNFNDEIVKNNLSYLISKQKENGSFEDSVDLTASFVSLSDSILGDEKVSLSYQKAKEYLKTKQEKNGGFGNVYSTSWVANAMRSLSEDWLKDGNSTKDYFASIQKENGSVVDDTDTKENKVWSIANAIIAMSLKSWNQILIDVPKPTVLPKEDANLKVLVVENKVKKVSVDSNKTEENKEVNAILKDIKNEESEGGINENSLSASLIQSNEDVDSNSYLVLIYIVLFSGVSFLIYKFVVKRSLK